MDNKKYCFSYHKKASYHSKINTHFIYCFYTSHIILAIYDKFKSFVVNDIPICLCFFFTLLSMHSYFWFIYFHPLYLFSPPVWFSLIVIFGYHKICLIMENCELYLCFHKHLLLKEIWERLFSVMIILDVKW